MGIVYSRTLRKFPNKTGMVLSNSECQFQRGKRTKVSERVRHTMLVVREASSFVPEIGMLRHERRVKGG